MYVYGNAPPYDKNKYKESLEEQKFMFYHELTLETAVLLNRTDI